MNELFAEAMIGKDAEEFLASDIGRYVLGRAEQEESDAVEMLARVSPWRRSRITQLQNEIWRARAFKGWLAELVITGHQALSQLEE